MYKVTKQMDNSISVAQYLEGEHLNDNDHLVADIPEDRGERNCWDIDVLANKIFVREKTELEVFQSATLFFDEEKKIALRIEEDFRLGLSEITGQEMDGIKSYLRAMKPTVGVELPDVVRPLVMDNYSTK